MTATPNSITTGNGAQRSERPRTAGNVDQGFDHQGRLDYDYAYATNTTADTTKADTANQEQDGTYAQMK